MTKQTRHLNLRQAFLTGVGVAATCIVSAAGDPLHHAVEATLSVPFVVPSGISRDFLVQAEFPGSPVRTQLFGKVVVRDPSGIVISTQPVEISLLQSARTANTLHWPPADLPTESLAPGFYSATLEAAALEPWLLGRLAGADNALDRVNQALASSPNGRLEQVWEFQVGAVAAPAMPAFSGLHRPGQILRGDLPFPYTAYLGNFHSQSNHSDGGGNVATCTSSQGAQTGQFGPSDAFTYARGRGLDFLMVSEHNHYFDGSSGTNSNATPAAAIGLYQSGLTAANQFSASFPDFLPIYGMEWGVISGGGHLNVIGSTVLWGWEYNAQSQLLAGLLTPKSDYASLYATMRAAGTIGQFNHPDASGFQVNGVSLAYSTDGDEVMVMSEILNTSAFSNNVTESETGQSSYASVFNRLLERGFHVAPASNQDNHCANWGASFTNRTAVLIPTGAAFNQSSLNDALRARRVFATTDKTSQIVFSAGEHLMGERITNTGAITLNVFYATSGTSSVSRVEIFEGVPQRNGTVTQLVQAATTTLTPTVGEHFYYAKVTQADGKLLWSAPIWVTQIDDSIFSDRFE